MTQIVKDRVKLLKEMNEYFVNKVADEGSYETWITYGVPENPCEEDFLFFAEDDKEWVDICRLFGDLIQYCI